MNQPDVKEIQVPSNLFSSSLGSFSDALSRLIQDSGLDVESYTLDHIALRPTSPQLFEASRRALSDLSSAVSSREVNGREILVFRLRRSIKIMGRDVDVVELPFPKAPVSPGTLDWDHVEFVVPNSARTVEEIRKWAEENFPSLATPATDIQVTADCPSAGPGEQPNPHVTVARVGTGPMLRLHTVSLEELREGSWKPV